MNAGSDTMHTQDHSSTLLSDGVSVFVFGGYDGEGCSNNAYLFNTSKLLQHHPTFCHPSHHTITLTHSVANQFDAATKQWVMLNVEGPKPAPRHSHSAMLITLKNNDGSPHDAVLVSNCALMWCVVG